MDDQRLERTLRTIDRPEAPDPRFLAGLYEDLAGELGFRAGTDRAPGTAQVPVTDPTLMVIAPPRPRPAPSDRRQAPRWAPLLAAALGGAALAGAIAVAFAVRPSPEVRPSLLARTLEDGVVTIVISDGRPQARSPRGAIGGFDRDVAVELAGRLGVIPDVVAMGSALDTTSVRWQVALPAVGLGDRLRERYPVSVPISWWPAYVIVPTGSPVDDLADLVGRDICVVAGSTGEDWLRQQPVRSATPTVQAPAAAAKPYPDDDACLDALAAGVVEAAVTTSIDPAGLATRGDVRAVGGPVLTEERGAVIDPFEGDPTELLAAIDAAIEAARADGTLADLARARFGGIDLSAPPSTVPAEEQP